MINKIQFCIAIGIVYEATYEEPTTTIFIRKKALKFRYIDRYVDFKTVNHVLSKKKFLSRLNYATSKRHAERS